MITSPIDLSSVQPLRQRVIVLIVYPIMHTSSLMYKEERISIEGPTGVDWQITLRRIHFS